MALLPPDKAARDKNLDALSSAVDEWADKDVKRLDMDAKFMRQVLDGRGAVDVGRINLDTASVLLQAEVDQFLLFKGEELKEAGAGDE